MLLKGEKLIELADYVAGRIRQQIIDEMDGCRLETGDPVQIVYEGEWNDEYDEHNRISSYFENN